MYYTLGKFLLSGSPLVPKPSSRAPTEPGVFCNSVVSPNCTVIQLPQGSICCLLGLKNCYKIFFSLFISISGFPRHSDAILTFPSVLKIGKCPEGKSCCKSIIPDSSTTPVFFRLYSIKASLPLRISDALSIFNVFVY